MPRANCLQLPSVHSLAICAREAKRIAEKHLLSGRSCAEAPRAARAQVGYNLEERFKFHRLLYVRRVGCCYQLFLANSLDLSCRNITAFARQIL